MFRITPKNLTIQILSVGVGSSISVEDLINIGKLFGFHSNAIRVSLARLAKDRVLESDERGLYRLHGRYNLADLWVNQWRQGVKKMKPWDGSWISVHLPSLNLNRDKSLNLKVLNRFGFKEGLSGLWVRPNNLSYSLTKLRQVFCSLGLTPSAEIFVAQNFNEDLVCRWSKQLWCQDELEKSYQQLLIALKKSYHKCQTMPLEQALVETFLLGGEVIWALARDPLLPESIFSQDLFKQLTQAMLDYDRLGRRLWAKRLPQVKLVATPVHLSLAKSA